MEKINAKDLRIGNLLVTLSEEPEIFVIDEIDSIEKTVCGNGLMDVKLSDLSPIPLAVDWLFRFGCRWDGACFVTPDTKQNAGFKIWQNNEGFFWAANSFLKIKLPCVHSLQNWFFTVTEGEELTIKP